MSWLYEDIEALRKFNYEKEVPQYVLDNLNPSFECRPYQIHALSNFITYYESPNMNNNKSLHTLFHMATGSGKTYIMAGLILYLYEKGYRNFLFFVNLSQIVKKTKDNFLNKASSKYLFAPSINIKGETINIKEVNNFQECSPCCINILFSTTAGLHSDLTQIKENSPSFEDFLNDKTVIIADEAHHLNVNTRNNNENENEKNWENTVNKIRESNPENVMLEFTATCDLENERIREKYEDKIVFSYNLAKFRDDKYSKDIFVLRSDFDQTDDGRMLRCLQALLLSQYRMKLFLDNRLNVKPVILFKSKTISESKYNKKLLVNYINNLDGSIIKNFKDYAIGNQNLLLKQLFEYFESKNLSEEMIAEEIKLAFPKEVFIDVNDDRDLERQQLLVNSLEDRLNPYRIIFEVEKLDEGWDCLNLFDIVRLYETRDAGNNRSGRTTIREAQLIGRGARYFPFRVNDGQEIYKRKFDDDLENPLRICEQLYYHCQNDVRYISELKRALIDQGIVTDNRVCIHNNLKESFKNCELYKEGYVFLNKPICEQYSSISDISEISHEIEISFSSGEVDRTKILDDSDIEINKNKKIFNSKNKVVRKKISQLVNEYGYNIVHAELARYKVFSFESLHSLFPKMVSVKEFICSNKYLGEIIIVLNLKKTEPGFCDWKKALEIVTAKIANELSIKKHSFVGSKEFTAVPLKNVFKEEGTDRFYSNPMGDGEGISQRVCSDSFRFDIGAAEWYAYEDNYGTTEEKRFVKYFSNWVQELQKKYEDVKLIRNEGQASIYSFDGGRRFEPDFLLYLKNKNGNNEYMQLFIEPKGAHLLLQDSWKEKFLLELNGYSFSIEKYDDRVSYSVWGLHFFSSPDRDRVFASDFERLLEI